MLSPFFGNGRDAHGGLGKRAIEERRKCYEDSKFEINDSLIPAFDSHELHALGRWSPLRY